MPWRWCTTDSWSVLFARFTDSSRPLVAFLSLTMSLVVLCRLLSSLLWFTFLSPQLQAHGLYPTVRYASEILVREGYVVFAADMPGHGKSPGLPGYLPGAEELVKLGTGIAKYALQQSSDSGSKPLPLFLVGSSMGATIALAVAQTLQDESAITTDNDGAGDPISASCPVAGVALLAPMLKLRVGELERHLLHGLALAIPTWEVIPSTATSADKQYRDPSKRDECESDPYKNTTGKIRVMSAYTCVDLCRSVQESFARTSVPFLVMVADQDVVVDSQGSLDLFELSSSKDKELKRYDALHGLLCEPPPLIETIQSDFLQWIRARTPP